MSPITDPGWATRTHLPSPENRVGKDRCPPLLRGPRADSDAATRTHGVVGKDRRRLETCVPACVSSSTVWKDREGPWRAVYSTQAPGSCPRSTGGHESQLLLAGASLYLGQGFLGAFARFYVQLLRVS